MRTAYSQAKHPFASLLGFMDDSVLHERNVDSLDRGESGDARSQNKTNVISSNLLPDSCLLKARALYSCESE